MAINQNYLSIFKEMQVSHAFDRLDSYQDPFLWQKMSEEERSLLAKLFLKHGEQTIHQASAKALLLFENAEKLAGHEAEVFYSQGNILYNYAILSSQPQFLQIAKEKLERALILDSKHIKAHQTLGSIYTRLGQINGDSNYFISAHLSFEEVWKLSKGSSSNAVLFWEWAKCFFSMGKQSGEALDFNLAIEKYQRAFEQGARSVSFYNDYGVALLHLSTLINSAEALVKAVELFAAAVKEDPKFAICWFHLGCAFQQLYAVLGQEELFLRAGGYFRIASELNPGHIENWLEWGFLLLISGRIQKKVNYLNEACEKFSVVCSKESDHFMANCGLAESLMLIGAYSDSFAHLRESREKILRVFEKNVHKPDAWCCYGRCLNEFGKYFADEEYYLDAIAKLQQGLNLDSHHPFLLHSLYEAYFALGELYGDASMIEMASQYCSKSVKYKGYLPYFWFDWGVALFKLGEMLQQPQYLEEAIEKYEKAIRLRGGIEGNPDLEWLYHLGCALDSLGDYQSDINFYKKAIALFSHILEKDSNHTPARFNLALSLSHLGELTFEVEYFKLSLEHFRYLNQENAEDEVILNDWGLTLLNFAYLIHDSTQPEYNTKVLEEAESKLLNAALLGSTQAFYNLACYYSIVGQYEMAIYFLYKAEANRALPPMEDLLHDEWLEGLKNTNSFRIFISKLNNNC